MATNWEIQGVRLDGKASVDAWDIYVNQNLSVTGTTTLTGALTAGSGAGITGNSTLAGNLAITGDLTGTGNITRTGDSAITGDITGTGDITRTGNLALTGNITGTGDITRTGDSAITGDITGTGDLTRTGTISLTNTTTGAGGILVNSTHASGDSQLELRATSGSSFLFTNQDGDLSIWSDSGPVSQSSGGSLSTFNLALGAGNGTFNKSFLKAQTLSESGGNYATGKLTINEAGADMDFEIIVDGSGTFPAAFKVDSNANLTYGSVQVDTEFRLKADTTSNILGTMPDAAAGSTAYSTTANAPVAFDGATWNTMGSSGTFVFYKDVQVTTIDYLNVSGDSGNTIQDYIMPYDGFIVGQGISAETVMSGGDIMNAHIVYNGTPEALGAVSIAAPDTSGFSQVAIGLLPFVAGDRVGAAIDVIGTSLPGKVSTNVVVLFVIPA